MEDTVTQNHESECFTWTSCQFLLHTSESLSIDQSELAPVTVEYVRFTVE